MTNLPTSTDRASFGRRASTAGLRTASARTSAVAPILARAQARAASVTPAPVAHVAAAWTGPARPSFDSLADLSNAAARRAHRKARARAVRLSCLAALGACVLASGMVAAWAGQTLAPIPFSPAAANYELILDRAADGARFVLDSGLTLAECEEAIAEEIFAYEIEPGRLEAVAMQDAIFCAPGL